LWRKEQAGRKFQLSRLLVYQAHLFGFFFDSRKWLKSLQELVAARQTEPALLHFEEVLAKLRIRLEPGFVFAMFCAQTALACVLIQNYKHGAPPRRPDTCPNLFPNNLESTIKLQRMMQCILGMSLSQGRKTSPISKAASCNQYVQCNGKITLHKPEELE
jgi:hypothetical protein